MSDYIHISRAEYRSLLAEATRMEIIRDKIATESGDHAFLDVSELSGIAGKYELTPETFGDDTVPVHRSEYRDLIGLKTVIDIWRAWNEEKCLYSSNDFLKEALKDA